MATASPQLEPLGRVTPAARPGLGVELIVSGMSVSSATCVTSPIDVVKTRLQLQKRGIAAAVAGQKPLGMSGLAVHIVRTEGGMALWKGLVPAVARGLLYGGLRLGLYEPTKEGLHTFIGPVSGSGSLAIKVVAGLSAGGLAAALTSPMELVKTRLQAASTGSASSMQVIRQVVAANGVVGLWRGGVPGAIRAALLNAGQCVTYDSTKRLVMTYAGWGDHVGTQVACALITGLASTTITNPADVVKTTMYVGGAGQRRGAWAATKALVAAEGPSVLFKGWLANYSRLGPQTLVTFLVAERLRQFVGLSSL